MNRHVVLAAALGAAVLSMMTPATAQEGERTDPWALLGNLVGEWHGEIDGILGTGTGIRSYRFILDGQYLAVDHASVRLPQEKSPRGDHHRDHSIYSYDRIRDKIIRREFTVEGFVNRYVCESEPKRIVCTAEETENGPGFGARLTLEIKDDYEFLEIFELKSPRQEELSVYFRNRWVRAPTLPGAWSTPLRGKLSLVDR